MPENYINVLVLIAVVMLIALAVVMSPRFRRWWDQYLTDRKRTRAHAGKVMCEEPGCTSVATRWTPNGYFCEWDFEPQIKRYTGNGKFVTWNHMLYHHARRP